MEETAKHEILFCIQVQHFPFFFKSHVILHLYFDPQTVVLSCILVFQYLGEESSIIIEVLPKLNIMS